MKSEILSTETFNIRAADPAKTAAAAKQIEEMGKLRGRPLMFPVFPSGRGSGPYVECSDGSVKLDLITGIGVHLFGYGHPEIMAVSAQASMKSPATQGTLMPGAEYLEVSRRLVEAATSLAHLKEDQKSKIVGTWLATCGTMANELALKIVRQKKFPAYKVITFKNAFAGRSTVMQEVTDEPKYREGQPNFDQVSHIDFFDSKLSVEENIHRTIGALETLVNSDPGKFAVLGFEPIQGEGGGFKGAPTTWWKAVLSKARELGLAIWFDEVQTFGRTGEVFAFQRLGIAEFVDVVSVAKPLQAGAVMWTAEYAPKPGLIGGTFAASTTALAVGAKILEMLTTGGYLGPQGKIQKLEAFIKKDWEDRKKRIGQRFQLGHMNILGGMVAFELLDGKAETIKDLLLKLLDRGVFAFSAGKDPVLLRVLPPVGVLTEGHWLQAMTILEDVLEKHYAPSKT